MEVCSFFPDFVILIHFEFINIVTILLNEILLVYERMDLLILIYFLFKRSVWYIDSYDYSEDYNKASIEKECLFESQEGVKY